ncbi:MAG: hypothetical protein ACI8QQ_003017 [Psychroserpens sp.]|jgi:hypothetical protein
MTSRNKIPYTLLACALVVFAACKLPNFSMKPGGKNNIELPGETVQVDFFENQSALASSSSSIVLTEGIRDLILQQSKMNLVGKEGDWHITGVISQYTVNPISIQAGTEDAAQNRLTMLLKVNCTLNDMVMRDGMKVQRDSLVLDANTKDGQFTAFVDFDASNNFTSVEDELLTELVRQLSQDVFDRVFGGKW